MSGGQRQRVGIAKALALDRGLDPGAKGANMSRKTSERGETTSSPWITSTGVVAHPGSPMGGCGPGGSRIPSILGSPGNGSTLVPHPQAPAARYRLLTAEDHLVLLADNSPRPAAKPQKVAKAKTIVLNLIGKFENPWKNNPTEEAKLIEAYKWSPATDSWEAVFGASTTTTIDSLSRFLGAIKQQQPQTIERINLFSHGNPGLIAFAGRIDAKTADVTLFTEKALDLRIADTDPIPIGGGQEQNTMGIEARNLQDRFTKDAQIILYLCHSGTDPELLQAIADAFHVVVRGFSQQVWVCPDWDKLPGPPKIDRGFTSIDRCKIKQRGFAHLVPDRSAKPK
jgi:hypothetical protein